MSSPVLGILGVGEAGGAIASGLHEATGARIRGFDLRVGETAFRERAAELGIELCASLQELITESDVVLVLTWADGSVELAAAAAEYLEPDDTYVDLNSASPATKQAAAAQVEPTGATFGGGAIMAAVPAKRNRVPILVSGTRADEVAATLRDLHLNVKSVGERPGQASAIKMLRSSILKGIDSLVLECLQAAAYYGVADRVLASVNGSMHFDDWRRLADYVLSREIKHGARAEELRQAADTVTTAGVEPFMARAGSLRIQHFVDASFAEEITAAKDDDGDFVDAFLTILKQPSIPSEKEVHTS